MVTYIWESEEQARERERRQAEEKRLKRRQGIRSPFKKPTITRPTTLCEIFSETEQRR